MLVSVNFFTSKSRIDQLGISKIKELNREELEREIEEFKELERELEISKIKELEREELEREIEEFRELEREIEEFKEKIDYPKAPSLFNISAACINLSICISCEAESPLKHFVECSRHGSSKRKWNGRNVRSGTGTPHVISKSACSIFSGDGKLLVEIFLRLFVMGKNKECHPVKPAVHQKGGKQIEKLFKTVDDASVDYS
ncbi:hypothetical protein ZIOFF_053051 [Zingiber officinale]|uniref:Uncharacterized protein n=1 Tax=Zingiber officinale TaxID=94328 RepID=A0A8J5KCP3_ZINOF|nr:hypothetical protein ZIOFF_053051 [Zingiber officinale]